MDSYKSQWLRYLDAMQLSMSRSVFSDLIWLERVDSTNLELQRRHEAGVQDFTAVIAGAQTSGQGRLGRSWESPAGSSLSISVLLRGPFSEPGWVSLLAALSVTRALSTLGVSGAKVKWPNDVLVEGKKISGILSVMLTDGSIVLGIGLNLATQGEHLPGAISLEELQIEAGIDQIASEIGLQLREVFADRQTPSSEIKTAFRDFCLTIGQEVKAELPNGEIVRGEASAVSDSGQLVILTPKPISLSAADVWHLRG